MKSKQKFQNTIAVVAISCVTMGGLGIGNTSHAIMRAEVNGYFEATVTIYNKKTNEEILKPQTLNKWFWQNKVWSLPKNTKLKNGKKLQEQTKYDETFPTKEFVFSVKYKHMSAYGGKEVFGTCEYTVSGNDLIDNEEHTVHINQHHGYCSYNGEEQPKQITTYD